MPDHPPLPVETAPETRRQQLTLQVLVLTRLRLAAAQAESWATLKMLSGRLAKAKAALDALPREG